MFLPAFFWLILSTAEWDIFEKIGRPFTTKKIFQNKNYCKNGVIQLTNGI